MRIPCPTCNPCTDPSNPFQNFSAEAPDVDHVFCYGSSNGRLLPGAGRNWNVGACNIIWGPVSCYSTADEDCEVCLQSAKWLCNPGPGPNMSPGPQPIPGVEPDPDVPSSPIIGPDPNNPPGPLVPRPIYGNRYTTCSAECEDGTGNVFAVNANQFYAYSQAEADAKAYSSACARALRRKFCLGDLKTTACYLIFFNETIELFAGPAIPRPITFSITDGALPPDLAITTVGESPRISGTPTTFGNYVFTLTATAADGTVKSREYTIDVLGSTCPTAGAVCTAYSSQLVAHPTNATFSVSGLPCGLSCDAHGLITGTPYQQGTFDLVVTVTDPDTGETCDVECQLVVDANPAWPTEATVPADFNWTGSHFGTPGHEGTGTTAGAGNVVVVTSTAENGFTSTERATSNALRNCSLPYFLTIRVDYALTDTGLPGNTGQVHISLGGIGIPALTINNIGGVNPFTGTASDTLLVLTSGPGPSGAYFDCDAYADGGSATMRLTVTFTPALPPYCI